MNDDMNEGWFGEAIEMYNTNTVALLYLSIPTFNYLRSLCVDLLNHAFTGGSEISMFSL